MFTVIKRLEDLTPDQLIAYIDKYPIAIPTETVYGLASKISNVSTLASVYTIKNRPADNPLIVHVSSLSMLKSLVVEIPPAYRALIDRYWPGPLTLLFLKNEHVNDVVTCGSKYVGIRMPSNECARRIIEITGPLAAPSANISGSISPSHAQHVYKDLAGKIELIVDDGPCKHGLESTIFTCYDGGNGAVLRPGAITQEMIETVIGRGVATGGCEMVPGKKYRHYAPTVPFYLFDCDDKMVAWMESSVDRHECGILNGENCTNMAYSGKTSSLLVHGSAQSGLGVLVTSDAIKKFVISRNVRHIDLGRTKQEISNGLYHGLRMLDGECACICMVRVDRKNEGMAIMDRVNRAAGQLN
ncbi:Sua5/YciO/YrdC/YwlC family protein [Vavraia culicis subsp. floridensis]|uniref:Threonylcarbamoyl-AMP synthase n=1 Tax=Vavraia culicis (isolate floridensis) TaxID=948595 RepID=L2GXI7_VAVCU|nr:Sua5/YciO/YrdC/YwlC family protein [Vavraia culicis subsp. floridensis]ELA47998.1 Sua5/YciO/YrdC/YwlC family protein [Vavraia culicis subsp. floridensis]